MNFYVGTGIGLIMIIGSAAKMFSLLNQSVMIKKVDFEKIEKKIRLDERRKTIEQFNK